MAVVEAQNIASLVAAYLRKLGLTKSLSAFLVENGPITSDKSNELDLETIYKSYISTQANGAMKVEKKKRKTKAESRETVIEESVHGDTGVVVETEQSEEPSNKKTKKKVAEKEGEASQMNKDKGNSDNANGDVQVIIETEQSPEPSSKKKTEKKKPKVNKEKVSEEQERLEDAQNLESTEKVSSKKDKKEKKISDVNGKVEVVIVETEQSEKLSNKKKKRKKTAEGEEKGEAGEMSKEKCKSDKVDGDVQVVIETEQSQKPSSKKRKEKKVFAEVGKEEEVTKVNNEKANKKQEQSENAQNVDSITEISSKKNKKEKKVSEANEIEEVVNVTTEKKKKSKKESSNIGNNGEVDETVTDTVMVDANASNPSHEKAKKKTKANGVHETQREEQNMSTPSNGAVQKDDSIDVKVNGTSLAKKRKSDLPSGALAFRRVEAEKVEFSDPRLCDNSYWAKDGAEEGYGAKAQEILGVVKGRDFRHEKTKKKRGSYRGGLIDLESHSIKFRSSDNEED